MSSEKKLVIIKISGASLKGNNDVIDLNFLNDIARQIKIISESYNVAIVLGGGNIWRGKIADEINMERYKADQMGMLATVMNSLALQSSLHNLNCKANIFSTIEMEKIADNYIIRNIKESLQKDEIAILACGTGRPYFSTDTGIAVSAAELNASYILMGKNNVDGVYDKDPNVFSGARFFEHLTYSKAINDELKVMDSTAAAICKEIKIKTIVFKINEPNGILDTLNLKTRFTLISEDENDVHNLGFLKTRNDDSLHIEYTDEEVEKFLEEEIPTFGKISDEEAKLVDNFLEEIEQIKKIENEQQKDFVNEFYSWKESSKQINNILEKVEKTLQDIETDIESKIVENNQTNDWYIKNEIPRLDNIDFQEKSVFMDYDESLNTNNENIFNFSEPPTNLNSDILFTTNLSSNNIDQTTNQTLDLLEKTIFEEYVVNESKKIPNKYEKFINNLDFYINEINKIKEEIVEENRNKTNKIRELIKNI